MQRVQGGSASCLTNESKRPDSHAPKRKIYRVFSLTYHP